MFDQIIICYFLRDVMWTPLTEFLRLNAIFGAKACYFYVNEANTYLEVACV